MPTAFELNLKKKEQTEYFQDERVHIFALITVILLFVSIETAA